jgi:hypothetical protein
LPIFGFGHRVWHLWIGHANSPFGPKSNGPHGYVRTVGAKVHRGGKRFSGRQAKCGRKTERFEMRVPASFLKMIDDWRRKQDDLPSGAAAIRRVIELGLKAKGK